MQQKANARTKRYQKSLVIMFSHKSELLGYLSRGLRRRGESTLRPGEVQRARPLGGGRPNRPSSSVVFIQLLRSSLCSDKQNKTLRIKTLNGGSLGSRVDEERSQLR